MSDKNRSRFSNLTPGLWTALWSLVAILTSQVGVSQAFAQIPLVNGDSVSGALVVPEQQLTYSFTATAGDSVRLSVSGDMTMWMTLYAPDDEYLGGSSSTFNETSLALAGVYTVVIESWNAGHTGQFVLHFARMPGASEHGSLGEETMREESLTAGDIDTFTFTVTAGNSVRLSVSGGITMLMTLYGPNGDYLDGSSSTLNKASLALGGVYTVAVQSWTAHQTGDYDLHFVRLPGANEHGSLGDQIMREETLTAGDLDTYTFSVEAGDSVRLSVSGGITMWMTLYGPNGDYLDGSSNTLNKASLALGGVYTVAVQSWTAHQTGDYDLHFVRLPGANEHGSLGDQIMREETLTAGDLDTYTFSVEAGDSVRLSVSGGITMWMTLYGPNGDYLDGSSNTLNKASLALGGVYTVAVQSWTAHQTGDYDLHFVRLPGANEHGSLGDQIMREETLTAGDLDTYTFSVEAGDSVRLSVSGGITMWMTLYGPNGDYLDGSSNTLNKTSLALGGVYTVAVQSWTAHQTGDYDLHFVRIPGANEHGSISGSDSATELLTPGDLDTYTFTATTGDSVVIAVEGDITMWMSLYGPSGSFVASSSSNVTVNDLPLCGTYTLVVQSWTAHQSGGYALAFDLPVVGDVNGDQAVEVSDLVDIILNWGVCDVDCAADMTCDGVVDVADLVVVLLHWGG